MRYNRGTGGKDATVWNVSGRYQILAGTLYVQGVVATAFLLPSAEAPSAAGTSATTRQ